MKERGRNLARLQHVRLELPDKQGEPAELTRAAIAEHFRDTLGLQPAEPLGAAFSHRRRGGPRAKPVHFLDWGTYGEGHGPPLVSGDLETWIQFCRDDLEGACPPDARVLAYLSLVSAEDRHALPALGKVDPHRLRRPGQRSGQRDDDRRRRDTGLGRQVEDPDASEKAKENPQEQRPAKGRDGEPEQRRPGLEPTEGSCGPRLKPRATNFGPSGTRNSTLTPFKLQMRAGLRSFKQTKVELLSTHLRLQITDCNDPRTTADPHPRCARLPPCSRRRRPLT